MAHTNRVKIHIHLLTSLLCYSTLKVLLGRQLIAHANDMLQIQFVSSSNSRQSFHFNPFYCLTLTVSAKYFRCTTYFWMFNEAFYLHQLMSKVFTTPNLKALVTFAYVIPLITNTSYIITRSILTNVHDSGSYTVIEPSPSLPKHVPSNKLGNQALLFIAHTLETVN